MEQGYMDDYQDLTIAISATGIPYQGRFRASLVASTALDALDESILQALTGYGETPLEAAVNLLANAQHERRKREK